MTQATQQQPQFVTVKVRVEHVQMMMDHIAQLPINKGIQLFTDLMQQLQQPAQQPQQEGPAAPPAL